MPSSLRLSYIRKIKYLIFFIIYIFSSCSPANSKRSSSINKDSKRSDLINKDFRDLVFGYLRKEEKSIKNFVPESIKLICLLFYYGKDYFNDGCTESGIKIHNDCQIITMAKDGNLINTAYGSLFINLNQSDKKHIWKFKILSCHGYIYIGLDEADARWKNDWFAGRKETNNYSYCCNGRKYSHRTGGMGQSYSQGFYIGSVVLMKLDLSNKKKGQLSFGIMKYINDWQNDDSFVITPAFKHIKKNKKMKLAVSIRHGSTVQLLEYKEQEV